MCFCSLEAGGPCQLGAALPDVFQLEHTIVAGLCLDDHAVNQIAFSQIQTVHVQLVVTVLAVGFECRCYVGQVNFRFCSNGCGQGAVCKQLLVCCRNCFLVFVRGKGAEQAAQNAGCAAVLCVSSQLIVQTLLNGNFYAGNTQDLTAAVFVRLRNICGVCKHAVPFFFCCRSDCVIVSLCAHTSISGKVSVIRNLAVSGVGLVAQFAIIIVRIRDIHGTVYIFFRLIVYCECEVLISGSVDGNIPSAVAVCAFRQLAAVALGQTQLDAHCLVHPVVCGKLGAVGSQNSITVTIVIPANGIHMRTQVAVITVDVYTDEITVAGIVLYFADLNRTGVYHLAVSSCSCFTLGELECAVLLLFCGLDAGCVGVNLHSLINVDKIALRVAAGEFCAVFVNGISFLEVLVIRCRNSNRNILRTTDNRMVVCTNNCSINRNVCCAGLLILDNINGFALTLAGVVVAVAVGIEHLNSALIAASVQTVVAGCTCNRIKRTHICFVVCVALSGGCFPVAVCGTVQINALILPVFRPCHGCIAVDIIACACLFRKCRNGRSDLCSCKHSGRCCADQLFPVNLSHNDLLKIFDFAALRGAAAFGVCFHKKCNAHFHQKLFTGTRSNIVNPIAFPGCTTKFDLSIS